MHVAVSTCWEIEIPMCFYAKMQCKCIMQCQMRCYTSLYIISKQFKKSRDFPGNKKNPGTKKTPKIDRDPGMETLDVIHLHSSRFQRTSVLTTCTYVTALEMHRRDIEISYLSKRALRKSCLPSVLEPPGLDRGDGSRPDGKRVFPFSGGRGLVWDCTSVDTFCYGTPE